MDLGESKTTAAVMLSQGFAINFAGGINSVSFHERSFERTENRRREKGKRNFDFSSKRRFRCHWHFCCGMEALFVTLGRADLPRLSQTHFPAPPSHFNNMNGFRTDLIWFVCIRFGIESWSKSSVANATKNAPTKRISSSEVAATIEFRSVA